MKRSQQFLRLIPTFIGLLLASSQCVRANPTGGAVASGTASISNSPGTTTINQSSNAAIINWQTFSINHGESTHFLQPGNQSAVLNRVLGGSSSQINGTLSANGQVYLINQNGILVGPGGIVNAAGGFTGSTRDTSNSDFLNGHLHFVGHGNAGVKNAGQIRSSLGNVVLIGRTVANKGKISARSGTVGFVAGEDVLLGQTNPDGATILVAPSQLAKHDSGKTAISNTGTLVSAAATLKAANGNIYAMAINNGGTIRAISVSHQGGHILLNSDSGTIYNSGLLNASATSPGGHGGTVQLKSGGTVSHTGAILAKGGLNGVGGRVDISGAKLVFKGAVNLTAPGGTTGDLLLDPATLQVVTGGNGTVTNGQNNSTSTTISPSTVDTTLGTANLILNADNGITISNGITWTAASTLTLSTNNSGSTISINAPISDVNGGLTIKTAGASDVITPNANGSINVGAFILQSGDWNQNANGGTLANFATTSDFELQGASTFLRAGGGNGLSGNPYQITDVYGLQGIGSPSATLLGNASTPIFYRQTANIAAEGTATWNGGLGFSPISIHNTIPFTGTYNGNNYTIAGLTINRPGANYIGLFSDISGSTLQGIGLIGGSTTGNFATGGLVGYSNDSTIETSYSTGAVIGSSGGNNVGGLVGYSAGIIENCYTTGPVSGSGGVGGLVGDSENYRIGSGTSYYPGMIETSYSTGTVNGSVYVGGLVGSNGATIKTCYATGTVGNSLGIQYIGGLVGTNGGTIETSYASGMVNGAYFSEVGGLAGQNSGTVETSYATGNVNGIDCIGGLVGMNNDGMIETSYSTGAINGSAGATYVGGLVGYNNSVIYTSYWAKDAGGQNAALNTIGLNDGAIDSYTSGKTLANLKLQSTFDPSWNFSNTWTTNGNTTTPLLKALSFNLSGTAGAGHIVDIISNGTLRGSTTASGNGSYSFLVPADVLSGALVTDLGTGTSNTFYNAGQIPVAGTSITGVNLTTHTLNIQGTGQSSNSLLGKTAGSLSTGTYGINYSVDLSDDLSTATGISIAIRAPYTVDGNITASSATLSTSSAAPLDAVASSVTLSGNNINLAGSLISSGTVAFNAPSSTTPNITDTGLVNVDRSFSKTAIGAKTRTGALCQVFRLPATLNCREQVRFCELAEEMEAVPHPIA